MKIVFDSILHQIKFLGNSFALKMFFRRYIFTSQRIKTKIVERCMQPALRIICMHVLGSDTYKKSEFFPDSGFSGLLNYFTIDNMYTVRDYQNLLRTVVAYGIWLLR